MKFIDEEHKKFVLARYEELQKYQKLDVYYKSIIYILGMCPTTRKHFDSIFNMREGEIFIEALQASWQTGTSAKVTRMAFSLWNECNYDSLDDYEKGTVSKNYNVSEIFCCGYAPYFWEGIKIRYPEYTKYEQHNADYYIKDLTNKRCASNNIELDYCEEIEE